MNEAEKIIEKFWNFTDGVRVLFLIHRKKEGGDNCDRKHIKRPVRNRAEFEKTLIEFLDIIKTEKKPYRIYCSANPRNVDKAIRRFKINQLEADYYEESEKDSFYFDSANRWVSCLMKPSSRDGNSFIIDIDQDDNLDEALMKLSGITRNYFVYKTKNGHHIVSQAFNPRLMEGFEIKKDGLLLLKY